ncbi:MAG: MotE family protein [Deferribacterales bacterium]
MKTKAVMLLIILMALGNFAYAESLANLQTIAQELEKRKLELDEREKTLTGKEDRIKALEDELLQKESELRKLKDTITARLDEIKTREDENLDALAKAYGSAKAKSAASIIAKMDLDKAVQLFLRMNSMTAGKIMSAMGTSDPVFAARISEKLTPDNIAGVNEK